MRSTRDEIKASAKARGIRGPTLQGEYSVCCPWCGDKPDTKHKLSLNPAKGLYHCYRCNAGGRTDLSWVSGAPSDPAELALEKVSLGPPEGFIPFVGEQGGIMPSYADKGALLRLPQPPLSQAPFAAYLRDRGVWRTALHINIGAGYCLEGRYGGRVVIPMRGFDLSGSEPAWTGFSSRTIYKSEPKYLYPAGMKRRSSLWGLEFEDSRERETSGRDRAVWLVEGVFDALPLWPWGIAAFGKNVTDEQLDLLVALGRPVMVALDGDAWEEGQVLAVRLVMRGVEAGWAHLPPGEDPGTLGWDVRKYSVGP